MGNPRDYAAPGNQDPATPWPDSLVLAVRHRRGHHAPAIALAAVISPLRHPLLLAKQLGDARPAERGPPGRAADRELARAGVRGARRAVPRARRDPGRATRGDGAAWRDTPAAFAGRHFSLRPTCTSSRSPSGRGPAHVVRRAVAAPGAPAAPRPLRPRLPPVRLAYCRGARAAAAALAEAGRDAATSRWWAASAGVSRTTTSVADLARGGRGDLRPPRAGVHVDLLQAVDVHGRGRPGRRALPRAGGASRDPLTAPRGADAWLAGFGTSSTFAAARSTAARSCASSARGPCDGRRAPTPEKSVSLRRPLICSITARPQYGT